MSTVAYYRKGSDTAATVETFDTDTAALARARYLAIDCLAVPVILTDTQGRRVYVSGRGGPTIGHRGIA